MKEKLAEVIRMYHHRGWSPATSTNYSFRDENGQIWVSRSGVDKSEFQGSDFITVDVNGVPTGEFASVRPSAETLIHCVLYELFPETTVILHSHSVYPVVLSANEVASVTFSGYEVQKGFGGESTHDKELMIPVFDNTQDMQQFKQTLVEHKERILHHCFIMRKHGTYAWGTSIFEAKRHLESLEYLSECEVRLKSLNN